MPLLFSMSFAGSLPLLLCILIILLKKESVNFLFGKRLTEIKHFLFSDSRAAGSSHTSCCSKYHYLVSGWQVSFLYQGRTFFASFLSGSSGCDNYMCSFYFLYIRNRPISPCFNCPFKGIHSSARGKCIRKDFRLSESNTYHPMYRRFFSLPDLPAVYVTFRFRRKLAAYA